MGQPQGLAEEWGSSRGRLQLGRDMIQFVFEK